MDRDWTVLNGPFIIIPIRCSKKYLSEAPLSWKCIYLWNPLCRGKIITFENHVV